MLYEVITEVVVQARRRPERHDGERDECGDHPMGELDEYRAGQNARNETSQRGRPIGKGKSCARMTYVRITSYNVCYTKLLRGGSERPAIPAPAHHVAIAGKKKEAPEEEGSEPERRRAISEHPEGEGRRQSYNFV